MYFCGYVDKKINHKKPVLYDSTHLKTQKQTHCGVIKQKLDVYEVGDMKLQERD